MGNEQSQQQGRKQPQRVPITKIQLDCMCMKLKGYFELSISRKQAEVNGKCKELLNMIRSPQRSKDAEMHKMISIAQDRNFIKGLELLNRYSDILLSRSQVICQSQGNPQILKDLLPMIEGLVWSSKHVNLKSLAEFTAIMKNFFGTEDFYAQVQNSPNVDPELKKHFEMLPQTSYTIDINILAILLCQQQGLTLEEINKAGHPFSQNNQQFYQNIGEYPQAQNPQQQVFPNQGQYQQQGQFPQQQQYQQNQYPNNFNQQGQYHNNQNLPQQSRFPQQYPNQYQPQQQQQYPNNQNNLIPPSTQQQQQGVAGVAPINPIAPNNVPHQQNYQVNVQAPPSQAQYQQPQVDKNGNPILFPVVNSVNVMMPVQSNQFGQNFVNSYDEVYKSNNIKQEDYSYPTFSKLQDSTHVIQNHQDDEYVYVMPPQNNQVNNNQINPNNNNNNLIPSNIVPANKFPSNNQIQNGQLPNNFKAQNVLQSNDFQFVNQVNNNLNNINPSGNDISKIKEQLGNQGMNVNLPQLNIQPSNEFKQQQPIVEKSQEDSPKKNQIKYPTLNNNQQHLQQAHQQQLNNLQNNIQKQNQLLNLKNKEDELKNDLQSKLQLLQQELEGQSKGLNSNIQQQAVPFQLQQQPSQEKQQPYVPQQTQNNNINQYQQQQQQQQQQNVEVPQINQYQAPLPLVPAHSNEQQQQNNANVGQQQQQVVQNNFVGLQKAFTLPNNNQPPAQQQIFQSYLPNQIPNQQNQPIQQNNINNNLQVENTNNNNQQADNHATPSNFDSERIQIVDINQILKEMNIEVNDKNVQNVLGKEEPSAQNNHNQDFMMSNIIKEINDMRNTVNFNQNEYQDNDAKSHPTYSK